jgi:hypothetical protein
MVKRPLLAATAVTTAGIVGVSFFALPPAVALAVVGDIALLGGTGFVAYHASPAVRNVVDAYLLAAPPSHKLLASPPPTPEEAESLLADMLLTSGAPATGETIKIRKGKGSGTATERLVQRAAAPNSVSVARPDAPSVPISYHPELQDRYAEALGIKIDRVLPPTQPSGRVLSALAQGLGATAIRVAGESGVLDGPTPVLALLICPPPSANAEQHIGKRVASYGTHGAGRASGVLVAIGAPMTPYVPAQPAVAPPAPRVITPPAPAQDEARVVRDDPALDEPVSGVPTVVLPEQVLEELIDSIPAPLPVIVEAPRVRRTHAVIDTGPDYPTARLVGRGAFPTVEVTIGRGRNGQWFHMPLKHGIVANSSGSGKTNIFDLLLGQVQGLGGVEIWYGTAKPFVPIDPEDGLDRRPLVARIPEDRLALNPEDILPWLYRVYTRMHTNYRDMQANPGWFPQPSVICLDEYKAYLLMYSSEKMQVEGGKPVSVADYFKQIVKQVIVLARESGSSFVFTSQDGYCESVGLSRGELRNLGMRVCHPQMDANSLDNVLPGWSRSPLERYDKYDWVAASPMATEVVAVPRVSPEMFRYWGLLGADTPGPVPVPASVIIPAEVRHWTIDDAELRRWVKATVAAGERPTLDAAIMRFWGEKTAENLSAMRAAFERLKLIKKA